MEQITNVKDAITFLETDAQIDVEDISGFKWGLSDNDMNFSLRTDKELIEYANEQKEALNEEV